MKRPVNGTWFEFRHHTACEGKYWDGPCHDFTPEQWNEKLEEIASLGMKYIVLMASALVLADEEECYFKGGELPEAQLECPDPMEVMFAAADRLGLRVFVSCGFYGLYTKPLQNMTSPTVRDRAFRAMERIYELYGSHSSFYGWYYPDETNIHGHFHPDFIKYVNEYSAKARSIDPEKRTLIAPYGTKLVKADGEFAEQLKALDVDFVAYQDEVGVRKSTPEQTGGYYKALKEAHDLAGRSRLWADVELFDFEGETYRSALIPADPERVLRQLEAVSPYVEEILCYQYQGMVNRPGSRAYCGTDGSEELYLAIEKYNKRG